MGWNPIKGASTDLGVAHGWRPPVPPLLCVGAGKMTQLVLGGFPLGKVLTHQLPIDEFQEGFDLMEAGKAGKVVLRWN